MTARGRKTTIFAVHGAGVLLAGGMALAVQHGVMRPLEARAAADEQRVAKLRSLLELTGPWYDDHRDLVARHAEATAKVAAARRRLEQPPGESAFMNEAAELAESRGLDVLDWTTGATRNLDEYFATEIRGEFQGSFAGIGEFLDSFSQLPRIAKVSSVEVANQYDPDALRLTATFTLYYAADPNDTEQKRDSR